MDDLTLVDAPELGSLMMRLASATQVSQMNTRGPATSFDTSAALFPQNEQANFRVNIAASFHSMSKPRCRISGAV
jgi:hypothetical protein